MGDLLFLAHRIPFPPNKGDKIRSYHLLRFLASRYRVHVGAFVDDPVDWKYASDLHRLGVDELCLRPLPRALALARSLTALVAGKPLGLAYYKDRCMSRWVQDIAARPSLEGVVVFSSVMAQYITMLPRQVPAIVDFVDVDSEKWHAYSQTSSPPLSWVYQREARTLLAFERKIAAQAKAATFVSSVEAELFRRLAPEVAKQVFAAPNGVDTDFFSPDRHYPSPYPPEQRVLVFTGAMNYRPNIDAVIWFTKTIFPKILAVVPAACFYIVGTQPAEAVRRLSAERQVYVTGTVADMRPYLAHARAAVAPLRIARGVQNKLLEAMAMARPVIATPEAAEGIVLPPVCENLVSATPNQFAAKTIAVLLQGKGKEAGRKGREHVLQNYHWDNHLERFSELLTHPSLAPIISVAKEATGGEKNADEPDRTAVPR
ncbi:glycosyl transferases group 1 [Nitrosococcus oceani ATCC 19707]|uniref:Glycosyl transferases group 1 n=2 Tax=Nitrosococcus oceani TaxID=1229 RepID=Q3J9Q5_NITOC|nr:TIGR03087 family PEP-CTERM/XrtA system glycosyltransferase [Nitrosococcus oceani]ABA58441.1 glycosyl transferases group 1 [Nitrosococcus oceani ATCC 19707]KFI19154.1 glycosyl transferase family 1 [Nitrosococcus oceani C-27]GEM18835.1 glycosyl transferase family 1 [Nitrosococcus oceani]